MRLAALLLLASACGRFGFSGSDGEHDGGGGGDDDAPIRDAPSDGITSDGPVICPSGVSYCDGFEGTSLDVTWMSDPMVSLDTTHAHRGTKSVHVHSPAFAAGGNSFQSLYTSATTVPGSTIYLRGWFWLSALPASNNGLEFVTAQHPGSSTGDYVFVEDYRTTVYTQLDSKSDQKPILVPTQQWFCFMWKVVRSTSATGSITLQTDIPNLDLNLPNVVTDSTTYPVTLITLGIGFSGTNTPTNQPALDLWIDDVILDTAPHTCAE